MCVGGGRGPVKKYCLKMKARTFQFILLSPFPLYFATGGSLHDSVPLSVGRRRQNIARFHRRVRQVLLVLGNSGADSSILPVEEARAAVLQVLRVVERRLWG